MEIDESWLGLFVFVLVGFVLLVGVDLEWVKMFFVNVECLIVIVGVDVVNEGVVDVIVGFCWIF